MGGVSNIYLDVIEEETGEKPHVNMGVDGNKLADVMNNTAQVRYDRLYDRIFDNSELLSTFVNFSLEAGI